MSKSRASKMRGYAAKLGSKVPYKVQYDSKKMLTGTAIPSEQKSNKISSKS